MAAQWYCKIMGSEMGPMTSRELLGLARREVLRPETPVRKAGSRHWVSAEKVAGLFERAAGQGGLATEESPPPRPADDEAAGSAATHDSRPSRGLYAALAAVAALLLIGTAWTLRGPDETASDAPRAALAPGVLAGERSAEIARLAERGDDPASERLAARLSDLSGEPAARVLGMAAHAKELLRAERIEERPDEILTAVVAVFADAPTASLEECFDAYVACRRAAESPGDVAACLKTRLAAGAP